MEEMHKGEMAPDDLMAKLRSPEFQMTLGRAMQEARKIVEQIRKLTAVNPADMNKPMTI